jgi:hypothetical protein
MKKLFRSKAFKIVLVAIIIIGVCISAYRLLIVSKQANNSPSNSNGGIYIVAPGGEEIQAIYLALPEGEEISEDDLKNHPEIFKVSDFETLSSYTSKYIIPIWIDKDAIDLLPQGWINQYPQKFYPIIVIGYNNALYSMRERLGMPIIGEWVDWSKYTLEPDFSAWMIKSYNANGISSTMKGYEEPVSVEHILEVSNGLFKECFSTLEYKNTQYGFSFFLSLTWDGYKIVEDSWMGYTSGANGDVASEQGPIILIRNPQWTSANPRQDIPIMVFTINQWDSLQQETFHIGAAPIGPTELGCNSKYVFALPARYNFAFPPGFEEVDEIIQSKPIKAF